MPTRKGRKLGGRAGDSCTMPFHSLFNFTLVSGNSSFNLGPNSSVSPRSLIEADTWAHFRVKSYSFRLHPSATVRAIQTCGYVGGQQDTNPNTIAQVMELLPSAVLAAGATVPTEWVRVPKSDLAGPLPWYKTIPGTADVTEESPGTVCFTGTSSDVVQLEQRGVFEFKTAVATGNTPLAVAARSKLREERVRIALATERALLLKILGTSPVPVSSTSLLAPP